MSAQDVRGDGHAPDRLGSVCLSHSFDQDKKSKDVLAEDCDTLEEFWDTHSTAECEDVMEPVEVQIDLASSKV